MTELHYIQIKYCKFNYISLNFHKNTQNGFFLNFVIRICHLGLFYASMENLKNSTKHLCLFKLKHN